VPDNRKVGTWVSRSGPYVVAVAVDESVSCCDSLSLMLDHRRPLLVSVVWPPPPLCCESAVLPLLLLAGRTRCSRGCQPPRSASSGATAARVGAGSHSPPAAVGGWGIMMRASRPAEAEAGE
jgi:hypothetical protein